MGEYPKHVRYGLWFFAELGVIAATIPGGIESCVARFCLYALFVMVVNLYLHIVYLISCYLEIIFSSLHLISRVLRL